MLLKHWAKWEDLTVWGKSKGIFEVKEQDLKRIQWN